jgi:hypothetical protein
MILRLLKFTRVAAALAFGLIVGAVALGSTPAAAGGCGYGCGGPVFAAPVVAVPVVVQPYGCGCCGCGGGGFAYGYNPYYSYAAYGYGAEYAPYAYTNRFYRPRVYVGPRRGGWARR